METRLSGLTRFHTIVESPHAGVIGTDDDGTVRYCSLRAAQMFGYAETDIVGSKAADLIVSDGVGGAQPDRRIDALGRKNGGATFPIDLTVVSLKVGGTNSLVWIVRERAPDDTPFEDQLTKLPNRAFSYERIRERLDQTQVDLRPFALLIVGLEGFDDLNRRAGRAVGDAVLVETAVRLRHGAPSADLVSRLGGAEFCIMSRDPTGPAELESLAQTLVESLAYPIEAQGDNVELAVKIGIALAPVDANDVETLIANAQVALDRAKQEGKDVCFYGTDVADRLKQRRQLLDDMRAALDKNEFSLDFLPLIDLATGDVAGAEALLRWHHPTRGNVPPLEFIPLAEESGLMVPIGSWVLREGLSNLKRWRDRGRKLRLSINISRRQLNAPNFVRQLSSTIGVYGCKPEWLEMELTETVAMQQAATVQLIVAEIRRLGVRVALDDFGTGYSSMAYLKSLPVDVTKIDRSFIDGVPHENNDSSMVRAIVAFALCTGREVRAEGVSSMEQARWLHAEGCDAAQGFFFSKPIPAAQFEAWLAQYEAEGVAGTA